MTTKAQNNPLYLRVFLQPKASADKVIGVHGDELKIAVTAPPVEGKANAHLQKFLSKQCKVAKSQVRIEKGQLSRHKRVFIEDPQCIPPSIQQWLELNNK